MLDLDGLNYAKGSGFVTVVTQDAVSGAVLMVAHADRAALERTIETGEMHYHSRTRGLWRKGATSGNTQRVISLRADCDGDAVLARVVSTGPACHTGQLSCFDSTRAGKAVNGDVLSALAATIRERVERASVPVTGDASSGGARPSYTVRLLDDRNLRLKKLGEEVAELITACADDDAARAAEEAADLLYHVLVALHAAGASLAEVRRVLAERAGSGPHREQDRP